MGGAHLEGLLARVCPAMAIHIALALEALVAKPRKRRDECVSAGVRECKVCRQDVLAGWGEEAEKEKD